jgi:hypothetical protein
MSPSPLMPSLSADKLHVDVKKNKDKNESATTTLSFTNKAYEEDIDDDDETRKDDVSIQMNEDELDLKF